MFSRHLRKVFLLAIFLLILGGIKTIQAANLFFSPASGSQKVGQVFSTSVFVSSSDQAMNASSGTISFPSDKLEVVSISKNSSIFNLWPQEPSYSNTNGTINFEGIVLNPGFTGPAGNIISIQFKVKNTGNAGLSFSSGSILANDGLGTNILSSLGKANFSLINSTSLSTPQPESYSPAANTPLAPRVSSSSHSDPNQWYQSTTAKLSWPLPEGITGARLLLNKNQSSIPTITYTPAIDEKEIPNLTDGVWYFHIRLKNSAGWGAITHFRIQIDSTKPDLLEIEKISSDDFTKPRVKFAFNIHDKLSGLDRCEIRIDGQNISIWRDSVDHIYETSALPPGEHTLDVKAIDSAGNFKTNSTQFSIEAIETPKITDYSRQLNSGENLIIKGKTYPQAKVNIYLKKEGNKIENYQTTSDSSGYFIFTSEKGLNEGLYTFWLEAVDQREAKSLETEKISLVVNPSATTKTLMSVIKVLAIIVPIIALTWLIIYLTLIIWKKIFLLRKNLKKEIKDVESTLDTSFKDLQEDIKKSLVLLEKTSHWRQLTQEEVEIFNQLKKGLAKTKRKIKKEIRDVKKELK